MELHYKIDNINDEHKPWLVLINGLFASLESWDSVVEILCEDFRLLRFDGRGQGQSPRPLGPYYLNDQVNDLKKLLESVGIQQAFFLGLSNGGRVALEFASRYPAHSIAIAASDTYERVSPLLRAKLNSWLEANRVGGPTHRFDVATPWVWGESIIEKKPEIIEYYRLNAHKEKLHVIEGLICGALQSKDIVLEEIQCPTLLSVGEEDLLTPPFMHKKMLTKLPQGELVIVPGGHASLLEEPASIEKVIIPYFKQFMKSQLTLSKEQERPTWHG